MDNLFDRTVDYNTLWARPGLTLTGRGGLQTFDPGTGTGRYLRSLEFLRSTSEDIGFVSFTFDPAETGSVVVVPETVERGFDPPPRPIPPGSIDEDDTERWPKMVAEALIEIERGSVEKVVLSRRLRAGFDDPVDPFLVARRLIDSQAGCNVFVVDGLVGASPELLLGLGNGAIRSVPLAGSATGDRPDLRTEKNAFEHKLAADSVDAAFTRAAVRYSRHEPEIVSVGELRHLGTRFEGTTPDSFGFHDILGHLHPTAAVAGTPTDKAVQIIREMEETSRGRYSGPVGWFDRAGHGEFAVALRCGLIEGTTALLHSGAGIVAGSNPEDELEETVWKLKPMLDALGLSAR